MKIHTENHCQVLLKQKEFYSENVLKEEDIKAALQDDHCQDKSLNDEPESSLFEKDPLDGAERNELPPLQVQRLCLEVCHSSQA